jgi:hypothetical protein
MVNHNENDRREIFDMLKMKGTTIACLECYDLHYREAIERE